MFIVSASNAQPITPHVLHGLYTEVMLLADEARAYFERHHGNDSIAPELAVAFSCESLKVTTRLMHSIAWLLSEKAVHAGEIEADKISLHNRELGYAPPSDQKSIESLPAQAQYLIAESEVIYARLERISQQMINPADKASPHDYLDMLEQAF